MTPSNQTHPEIIRLLGIINLQALRFEKLHHQIIQTHPSISDPVDLFYIGIIDRTLQLTQAFRYLVSQTNYTTSGAILRLHLDSLLKLAYVSQAEDSTAIVLQIIEGVDFRRLKDSQNRPLTDANLLYYVERFLPKVRKLYKDTSGLIHFSEKFLFSRFIPENEDEHPPKWIYQEEDESWPKDTIQSLLNNYIEISNTILVLMDDWSSRLLIYK